MGGKSKLSKADIPAGHHDPLSYAVTARDRSVVKMVESAVKHRQVKLAYQPVVPARNHETPAFYEALVRVLDETGRAIPAREFIDVIEETETGRIIDSIALEKGIQTLSKYPDLRLSVNMSARSIGYSRWMRTLKRGIGKDPTVAERLILEISESSAMMVPELVIGFMHEQQSKGISFALDDFGAGQTSLRHLPKFYFDILKIDEQFIKGIADNADNQVLTAAIAMIAENFDMLTVAENVETARDAAYLKTMGIDCLQGYLFGAPTIRAPWLDPIDEKASA